MQGHKSIVVVTFMPQLHQTLILSLTIQTNIWQLCIFSDMSDFFD